MNDRICICRKCGIALIVSLILISCSRSEETDHIFTILTEDGIPTAVTEGGPRFNEDLFIYEEMLEIHEGDSEASLLSRPSGIYRDGDGNFYVWDGGDNRIAVFNSEGEYTRQIGREGDGPGEFRGAIIHFLHNGVISLFSLGQSRTTRYQTDGTLLDVTKLPGPASLSVLACVRISPELGLYAKLSGETINRIMMWVEYGLFTVGGDTLWTARTDPCEVGVMESAEFQGLTVPQPRPYQLGDVPTATYHPSVGLVISAGIRPELGIYDNSGSKVRVVRISLTPNPITAEQRDWVRKQYEDQLSTAPESFKPLLQKTIDNLRFAEHLGFWDDIIIDTHGWIWLRIPEPDKYTESLGRGRQYRVLNTSGEYLGITRLPKGSRVSMSYGYLMANEADPMTGDEVRLIIYRIQPAVPDFQYP